MELAIECECGWRVQGPEAEVVAATQRHGREVHHLDLTRDQVLAAAKPLPEKQEK